MIGARQWVAVVVVAVASGLTACGGGYAPLRESEMAVESRLGWPAERCGVMAQPATLPALHRLADTARLHDLDAREGALGFGVTVSARGDVETVRMLLAGNIPAEARREIEDRLIAALLTQEAHPTPWTVRLNRSAEGAWAVERGVYCSPRVAQSPGFSRFTGTARPRGADAIEVRVSVTESGFGESVELPRPAPSRELEAGIRQQAMTLRFLPAMLNGEPVPSVFTYYVSLRRTRALRR